MKALVAGVAPPASQSANLDPLVEGPAITLAGRHTKVRREGYAIFDRYAHGREGARALAVWLNESGHRTKAGRPWSHTAVLTVLRNPVYVGKVFFRDALHDGPHEHLVEEKLFSRVQAMLSERGEDWSKRASATSPFLLAGLVVCDRCGKHFVGTSAVVNRYRYLYYTCFTRQRYGTKY
jgi:site-specific DNA recombinase